MALKVPTFVVVTKADLCSSQQTTRTISQLQTILSSAGCRKVALKVENESDVCTAAQRFTKKEYGIAPIFQVSCVTGKNLDLLYKFLNTVPPLHTSQSQEKLEQQPAEFHVDELFNVPEVGTVLGGILTKGVAQVGDHMMVGPNECGRFTEAKVATIRRNRTPCSLVKAGQAATLTLDHTEHADFRKGTVIFSPRLSLSEKCNSCSVFVVNLHILSGSGIKRGFQGTVFVASCKQNAIVVEVVGKENLCAGQSGCVRFEFLRHPELLRVGRRVLLQEGMTRGIGEITELSMGEQSHEEKRTQRKPSR